MTMLMNLHPQYITDENGKKLSVIIPIEEFENLVEQSVSDDLSCFNSEIQDGINSPLVEQSHKEVFKELKLKYI